MDKLKSGKTITIKINGKNQPFVDEQKMIEDAPFDHGGQEAGNFDHQDVFQETAVSQELLEESFDWILPEQNSQQPEVGVYKKAADPTVKKSKSSILSKKEIMPNKGVKSILLSVVFAVMVGTSFGFVMLKLVVTNHSKPAAVVSPSAVDQTGNAASSGSESVILKPFTAYVVQEGVYSSKDSADNIAKLAKEKGVAAGEIEIQGKHFLFLGVASSLEGAKGLETIYKEKGIGEPYSKALSVPEKKLSKLNPSEKAFLEAAQGDFLLLSKAAASAVSQPNTVGELQKLLAASAFSGKEIKNSQLNKLSNELTGAAEELKTLQKNKDQEAVIKAQQHLLAFLQVYYSL